LRASKKTLRKAMEKQKIKIKNKKKEWNGKRMPINSKRAKKGFN